ncbi:thioredoxin-dependent thiol peroxidase [Psychromicrobium xiongbiense]|uniref:thioredoxin-dependent thiol peroxidase n=1 Tax=Psychromicrobium xiongbiense TaxID=3051184 RepID=UPI0025525E8D|nr:thioredoxin-dependent thiol peroxidase [Psychromicrobium sp. YIM S02556]
MTQHRLSPGDQAPEFSLLDARGTTVSLREFRGRKVILYFYPAASTPACTTQACNFRDNLGVFSAAGYAVIGLSPDSAEDVARFAREEDLTFPLLADPGHLTALAYGTWGEKKNYGRIYQGLIRSTFVLDEQGVIVLAQYNVRATGHVAKLRRDLKLD